jgi:hypothetical protein
MAGVTGRKDGQPPRIQGARRDMMFYLITLPVIAVILWVAVYIIVVGPFG